MRGALRLSLPGVVLAAVVVMPPGVRTQAPSAAVDMTAASYHARGVELHTQRRLDEASREYARALTLEPPRTPSAAEMALIRRFAPRLHTAATEFFPLKDAAAVLHPSERLIAYHLFWEDDIDFPDDNDPCDHEVVWVQFAPDRQTIERFWTYFHGRILEGGEISLRDARANGRRPRVDVQWGKHGSLPVGWESMSIVAEPGDIEREYLKAGVAVSLRDYNRATWQKLTKDGRRSMDHPLSRRLAWPDRFEGSWEQFVGFSRIVDPTPLLDRHRMVSVSRWNSAVINQQFLTYNFRPKTEWPVTASAGTESRTSVAPEAMAASLDDFQLPPKSVFDRTMPRYPNVWFHVDTSLVDSYQAAVRLIADQIRGPMRLKESYGPFSNPEGCDFEVTLEHLQPWQVAEQRALQHAHAFHMRYYYSALAAGKLERVTLKTRAGDRQFYRVAASAHYEVEHFNPHHADVEECPICGRTGEYAALRGNLVELVHDPLGVELLLSGTVRNEPVRFDDDGRAVAGLTALRDRFAIQQHVFPAQSGDRNTLRIGIVVLSAAR
jgi:hypothetical protein